MMSSDPMQTYHTSDVDLRIFLSSVLGVDRYEVSGFGESVNDHPNLVKLVSRTSFSVGSALTSTTPQNR
jgi:hypothetical protein